MAAHSKPEGQVCQRDVVGQGFWPSINSQSSQGSTPCLLSTCVLAKAHTVHALCPCMSIVPFWTTSQGLFFNTGSCKGRRQRGRSSLWYFFLNIVVLISCLSSSWVISTYYGTWLQLLWNPVAKAKLINCGLPCCWIQPASHVWAISSAKFACLLKIVDGFSSAFPFSLSITRKDHTLGCFLVLERATAGVSFCLHPSIGAAGMLGKGGRRTWFTPTPSEGYI